MAITKDIQNGSEIFFTAWNGSEGYTLDLNLDKLLGDWIGTDPLFGQTAQTTIDAAAVAATEYNASGVLFDGELTEFATAFNNDFTGVEWSLVAYDETNVSRSIVTADVSTTATVGTNDQANALALTLDNMATQVNGYAETSDEDTYHITSSSDGAAYAGQFGSTYQGNVFDTSNALDTTSDLYMVAQSSTAPADANSDGIVQQISTASGTDVTATTYQDANGVWKLKIEAAGATDGTMAPTFPGAPNEVTAYTGPVDFLEWESLGSAAGDVVAGGDTNDFLNLLGGDDAAAGGAGRDVLDGGLGSNFLTGGADDDIFFLDGRGTGSTTWSTITDFTAGDLVNIWGFVEGTSTLLLTQDSAGATGFEGLTLHYDLNNDGEIDTSITFSGLSEQQVPAGSAQEVAGNGYLLFT